MPSWSLQAERYKMFIEFQWLTWLWKHLLYKNCQSVARAKCLHVNELKHWLICMQAICEVASSLTDFRETMNILHHRHALLSFIFIFLDTSALFVVQVCKT